MPAYDFIGDIHGQLRILERLLERLGYEQRNGVYQHPEQRLAIFVGDIIDRGPEQREVVTLVRAMVDAGHARMVLGNHEYNAVLWSLPDPRYPGEYLRRHNHKHRHQHQAFLQAYAHDPRGYDSALEWFSQLPLWLELDGGVRVIHACWHSESQTLAQPWLTEQGALNEQGWLHSGDEHHPLFAAVETLLKGPEVELPNPHHYHDKEGIARQRMRVRWWEDGPHTWRTIGLIPRTTREQLPDTVCTLPLASYASDQPPVFFGHYWLSGTPAPLSHNAICLDYSVAKGGPLCAYRWNPDEPIQAERFIAVPPSTDC